MKDPSITTQLLNHGCNFTKSFNSISYLHLVCRDAGEDMVSIFLKRGLLNELNKTKCCDVTPFHFACLGGKYKNMIMVENFGDLPTSIDKENKTAMHYASMGGSLQIVKYLIKKEISPLSKDKFDRLSIHYAAIHGHTNVIEYLLGILPYKSLNQQDIYGNTPLYYCSFYSFMDCIELLLSWGADPLHSNKEGETPLSVTQSIEGLKLFWEEKI